MTLSFSENEYFTNDSITLSIKYKDADADDADEIKGGVINWKDGKDITKKKIKKKQKNKKSGETREVIKTVPSDSVFSVYRDMQMPDDEELEELEEEPDKETTVLLELIGMASQFMDDMSDMYNDSLEYYLNRIIGLDDEMAELGSDGSDDDSDSDDDMPKSGKNKKIKEFDEPSGPEGKKDCKQQ